MSTSVTPAMVAKPLSDFQKIGHKTYLYTPESYTAREPLILIFSWMGAAAKHIAKYMVAYQRLFPTARIVLNRNDIADMFRHEIQYEKLLSPALDMVKEHVEDGGQLLVHSYSNGGGYQSMEFAKAWAKREGTLLPMRAQILDSSPGKGNWTRSHAALSTVLPRSWLWRTMGPILVHLFLALIFIFDKVTMTTNKIVILFHQLNNPAIFEMRTPRVYLYSRADVMVGDDEVEEHADEAEAKGWDVTKVRFEKSPHAGHIREDEGRYWGAVLEAWKTGPRNS